MLSAARGGAIVGGLTALSAKVTKQERRKSQFTKLMETARSWQPKQPLPLSSGAFAEQDPGGKWSRGVFQSQEYLTHELFRHTQLGRNHAPDFVIDCILDRKFDIQHKGGNRAVFEKYRREAAEIIKIKEATRHLEEPFRKSQPAHVREVQKKIQHVFLDKYFKLKTTSKDKTILSQWQTGLGDVGPFPMTHEMNEGTTMPKLPPRNFYEQPMEQELRSRPPAWMTTENLKRLFDEFTKSAEFQRGQEIKDFRKVVAPLIYCFGSEQGEFEEVWNDETGAFKKVYRKLRRILDWRDSNQYVETAERVRLNSHACIMQMLATYLSPHFPCVQVLRAGRDVDLDIKNMQSGAPPKKPESH